MTLGKVAPLIALLDVTLLVGFLGGCSEIHTETTSAASPEAKADLRQEAKEANRKTVHKEVPEYDYFKLRELYESGKMNPEKIQEFLALGVDVDAKRNVGGVTPHW